MSELGVKSNEATGIRRQKEALSKWIEATENIVAEHLQRPAKFRPDAAMLETNMVADLQQLLLEKQAVLEDLEQRDGCPDNDIKIGLDTLESHLTMLQEKRTSQLALIEDFRYHFADNQAWLERMGKALVAFDEIIQQKEGATGSTGTGDRLEKVQELLQQFEENKNRPLLLVEKAALVLPEVSDVDQEQVNEQARSVERRISDMLKRLDRKRQAIELAQSGFKSIELDLEDCSAWIKEKFEILNAGTESADLMERQADLRLAMKDIEGKSMFLETLENKINAMHSSLESEESEALQRKLAHLCSEHQRLIAFATAQLKSVQENSEFQRKFEQELSEVQNWLKVKMIELGKANDHDPLKAYDIEKKVTRLKKELSEVTQYEEARVSCLKLAIVSLIKSGDEKARTDAEKHGAEIEKDLTTLKTGLKSRISDLEDKVDSRKRFELEFDRCVAWLDQADTILSTEVVRGSSSSINIAVLDDHLHKFKKLKRDEEENRTRVTEVFATANTIMSKLTDAEQITLQTLMDDVCDKQNHVADTAQAKIDNLVKNISIYRLTAQKIEDSVNHLTEIQRQIRQLNKPIGCRVEDAEDVLEAYEKILVNLKDFKYQMEDLQRTAGTNVNELRALLKQQEELILAIENQMLKIRNLIAVRHQFMTMITGITSFIIKHTEVVKETERSTTITSLEKVNRYEESIQRLKECETQLTLASDKGQQIANEGSTADRNQITSQLQSLKTQILTLKKAIEKKRDEHIQSVAENNRTYSELEECVDWLTTQEVEVKSRPLLSTTVQDVESHLASHKELAVKIMEYIDNIKSIQSEVKLDGESAIASGRICDLLSTASALIQTMPREMEARHLYLETNRNLRLQYDSLVERLNSWIEEAQIKLRPLDTGVDFVHLSEDLQDHNKYFSEETKLRELLHSIHDIANKIWASLATNNQDKINHEQEFLTQLVKNTLNSAHVKQREFEESLKTWTNFQETLQKARSLVMDNNHGAAGSQEPPDRPTSMAAVKTAILKVDGQIKVMMGHKQVIDLAGAEAKKMEELADASSRQLIAESLLELNYEWRSQLAELKNRKENLATLALQWEDFEAKYRAFESQLAGYHQKFAKVEMTSFSSVTQMVEMKKTIQVGIFGQ